MRSKLARLASTQPRRSVTRARAGSGQRVLIHAVGSGVSTAAVQLARWLGAVVVGVSRTKAKLEQAMALGVAEAIELGPDGFRSQLAAPVDVILDYLGGPGLAENLAALRPRGRLVLLGTLQGPEAAAVNVGLILRARLEIIGTVMRARPHEERVPLVSEFTDRVLPEIAAGRLNPVVGARFPIEDVGASHQAMETNRVFGKVILEW